MTQYTDASSTFTVNGGLDLTSITQPHLTFRQGETVVDVTDITILDATHFTADLSQAQTARFKIGTAKVQLNFFVNGKRDKTEVAKIDIDENLLKRVLSND